MNPSHIEIYKHDSNNNNNNNKYNINTIPLIQHQFNTICLSEKSRGRRPLYPKKTCQKTRLQM